LRRASATSGRFREVHADRACAALVIGDARLAELRVLGLKGVAASANPSAFRRRRSSSSSRFSAALPACVIA
jgi:hypothetical protein